MIHLAAAVAAACLAVLIGWPYLTGTTSTSVLGQFGP